MKPLKLSVLLLLVCFVFEMTICRNAGASITLTECSTLSVQGETYLVVNDITTSGNCLIIGADDITLDGQGHTLAGNGTGSGVYLNGRTGVTVKDLNVNNFDFGIYLYASSNNTLSGNTSSNNNEGIRIRDGGANTLVNNITSNNNGRGIYFYAPGSSDNWVVGNTATHNGSTGIYFHSNSSNNTITGNTSNDNSDYGIWTGSGSNNYAADNTTSRNRIGFLLGGSHNIVVDNTITGNNIYGILLTGAHLNITGNTISNNDWGIYSEAAAAGNSTFTGNTISHNNRGVVFYGLTTETTLYNNFFNNTYNFYSIYSPPGASWNTVKTPGLNIVGGPFLGGNFWGSPDGAGFSQTCTDGDFDGICDTAYVIVPGEADNLPLAQASPAVLMEGIMVFFDSAVDEGTLSGYGRIPALANLRLEFMRLLLEIAQQFIQQGRTPAACALLQRAHLRTDGQGAPQDFVVGEAVPELARLLQSLDSLTCEP